MNIVLFGSSSCYKFDLSFELHFSIITELLYYYTSRILLTCKYVTYIFFQTIHNMEFESATF